MVWKCNVRCYGGCDRCRKKWSLLRGGRYDGGNHPSIWEIY